MGEALTFYDYWRNNLALQPDNAREDACMTPLNSERLSEIKRLNGDVAVLRLLVAAKSQGVSPQDIISIAKDIGVGATNLARLKAQVGWTPDRRKVNRSGSDRRKRTRVLDRSKEKKAIRALLGTSDVRVSHTAYVLTDDPADEAVKLFSEYCGTKIEHESDTHVLFLVRETDADERLLLIEIDRSTGEASRLATPLIPSELASHIDEETFAELYPKAQPIDAIEADEVLPMLVQGAKAFDL
jgi:hypothetical protein